MVQPPPSQCTDVESGKQRPVKKKDIDVESWNGGTITNPSSRLGHTAAWDSILVDYARAWLKRCNALRAFLGDQIAVPRRMPCIPHPHASVHPDCRSNERQQYITSMLLLKHDKPEDRWKSACAGTDQDQESICTAHHTHSRQAGPGRLGSSSPC